MNALEPRPELYNVPFTTDAFNEMPYRQLGRTGLRASVIGLGTWKFGYPETGDGARVDEAEAMQILDRAIEVGVTFWDTANRYNAASGNSERVLGKWFAANPDQRRNVVLATKIFGGMDGTTPNHSRLGRLNIIESVYACLERLQIDCIDLLYFHRFDATTPVEESLCAIEDLVRQDTIRYLGVSNFSPDQLTLYQAAEQSLSCRVRIAAVQNRYDILRTEDAEHAGALDYCATNGLALVPYSPLAMGLLTDRYLDPEAVGPGDRLYDEGLLDKMAPEALLARIRRLAELARSWDLTLSQLALAYTLTLPGMGPMIPSSSSVSQLEANAAAGRVTLEATQIEAVRAELTRA
ncbi:MAG: aldo/keto reductase [Litorilinea sp.]